MSSGLKIIRKIAGHPMAALTIGVTMGTLMGIALADSYNNRYENHQLLEQVVPKSIMKHRDKGVKPFTYYTMNVSDENGKVVYQGNVLTLWNYPAHYVVVGNHGFEMWKKDDLERSIQSMELPMIRKTDTAGKTVAVPYFIYPPIKKCLMDVDIRGWDGKFFVTSLPFGTPSNRWIIDRSANGGKVVREHLPELKFVDSNGNLRTATIVGLYDHAYDFPSVDSNTVEAYNTDQSQQQEHQQHDGVQYEAY